MKTYLCIIKDKLENCEESGIYVAFCADCDAVYIGQTYKSCNKRFSEHYRLYHEKQIGKSTPADHMSEYGHKFAGFRLLKEVNKPQYLDAFENLYC